MSEPAESTNTARHMGWGLASEVSLRARVVLVASVLLLHGVVVVCLIRVAPLPLVPDPPKVMAVTWLHAEPALPTVRSEPPPLPTPTPPPKAALAPKHTPTRPVPPAPLAHARSVPLPATTAPAANAVISPPAPTAEAAPSPSPSAEAKAAVESPAPPRELAMSEVAYAAPLDRTYPTTSMRLGESGTVVLRVLVDAQGRAAEVHLARSSGFSRLDQAAAKAMRDARFKPHTEGGVPRPFWVNTPITYNLDG